MNAINIQIKRLHPDAVIPKYATELAAGFDLVAVEDTVIAPGETALVPTGLAFAIPEGYEMQIRPRSGVSLRTKLRVGNSPGTVDADFRGEVKVVVDNIAQEWDAAAAFALNLAGEPVDVGIRGLMPDGTYIIRKGDRIAQAVIAPVKRAIFEVVAELPETGRGVGGFGSTGVTDVIRKWREVIEG